MTRMITKIFMPELSFIIYVPQCFPRLPLSRTQVGLSQHRQFIAVLLFCSTHGFADIIIVRYDTFSYYLFWTLCYPFGHLFQTLCYLCTTFFGHYAILSDTFPDLCTTFFGHYATLSDTFPDIMLPLHYLL